MRSTPRAGWRHSSSSRPPISCARFSRPSPPSGSMLFSRNAGDDQSLVIVLRRGADERVHSCSDPVAHLGGAARRSHELLEALVAELVLRLILRFGNAVAVENDRRSGGEGPRLGHVFR